jgi:uncharacterized membrane protein
MPQTPCADTGITQGFGPKRMAFLSLDAHFPIGVIYLGLLKDLYFVYNRRTKESEAIKIRESYAKKGIAKHRVAVFYIRH